MYDELMINLKRAFKKEKDNNSEECPMTDHVFEYALEGQEYEKFDEIEKHLKYCLSCIDTYLEIRMAKASEPKISDLAILRKFKKGPDVLPGLKKEIDRGKGNKESGFQKLNVLLSEYLYHPDRQLAYYRPELSQRGQNLIRKIPDKVKEVSQRVVSSKASDFSIKLQRKRQLKSILGKPKNNISNIEPGGRLKSKDPFRFKFIFKYDAFAYIIFKYSSGDTQVLDLGFRNKEEPFFLPYGNNWYRIGDKPGKETIFLVITEKELSDLSGKILALEIHGIEKLMELFSEAIHIKPFSFNH
jgi:hypothetical protein